MHGARRGDGAGFFASLPDDDPHYVAMKLVPLKRAAKSLPRPSLFEGAGT
jgi:hypothetical protein